MQTPASPWRRVRADEEVEVDLAHGDRLGNDGATAVGLDHHQRPGEATLALACGGQDVDAAPSEFGDRPVAVDIVSHRGQERAGDAPVAAESRGDRGDVRGRAPNRLEDLLRHQAVAAGGQPVEPGDVVDANMTDRSQAGHIGIQLRQSSCRSTARRHRPRDLGGPVVKPRHRVGNPSAGLGRYPNLPAEIVRDGAFCDAGKLRHIGHCRRPACARPTHGRRSLRSVAVPSAAGRRPTSDFRRRGPCRAAAVRPRASRRPDAPPALQVSSGGRSARQRSVE